MVAKTFRCTIVTPADSIFDDEVGYASVPAWDGQVGVMVGASPMLCRLGTGGLRLDLSDGGKRFFYVDGGFAQVQGDVLTLLADRAVPAESLTREEAQAELAEANARVAQAGEDHQKVTADQQRAMAKLSVLQSAS